MPLYHIIILAIIQGVTEFLPVSSSGHLVLTHTLLGDGKPDLCWETNRLIDVAVHVGTLLSVLFYFRKDILMMLYGILKPKSDGFNLSLYIIIASVPVIIAGFALQMAQPSFLCLVEVMAWMTLIFGIVLYFADKVDDGKELKEMTWKSAFLIGLSQMLALIPGVSRSGITMISARFLGFSRVDAAKFSLLLSIIAISGAGFLTSLDLVEGGNISLGLDVAAAVILSFIAGYIAISLMMKWLSKATFMPFVIYRVALGIILLGLIYGGVL
jgi:undecaprenyl-diphosphatase